METTQHLLWLRDDLRLHDHAPLLRAAHGTTLLVVYCLDPRHFAPLPPLGLPRTGPHRAQFLLESLADLRAGLRRLGSELLVHSGRPETVVPALARRFAVGAVFAHHGLAPEELAVQEAVRAALNVPLQLSWGNGLYAAADLPFAREEVPDTFSQFRKRVTRHAPPPAPPLPAPTRLPPPPAGVEVPPLPTLAALGLQAVVSDPRLAWSHAGGETAGLARLNHYLWTGDHLRHYKQTRNGLLGADNAAHLSAWLAAGCLSPRTVLADIMRYEAERVKNASTYWLASELLWREFFRWITYRHGARLFRPGGIQRRTLPLHDNLERFEHWVRGTTGVPFADANMRELAATGFMSNRGRQNVASFLVRDLGVNWTWGAGYFESQLIDYDVHSNWGNWNYVAGVGNDACTERYFHLPTQAHVHDPRGDYVRTWLPALAALPGGRVHEPYLLPEAERRRYGLRLGSDYPLPVVTPAPYVPD